MAPHGHGPFGGRSIFPLGIQPVEPSRNTGKADIRAIVAPQCDQNRLRSIALAVPYKIPENIPPLRFTISFTNRVPVKPNHRALHECQTE